MAEIKNKNPFSVLGYDFKPEDERFKDVKTVEDVAKLNLFEALSNPRDREWGNQQVLNFLQNRGVIEDISGAPSTTFTAFPHLNAANDVGTVEGVKTSNEDKPLHGDKSGQTGTGVDGGK